MPVDSEVAKSLAYRKNERAIWDGKPPEKYTRILPYVKGKRVVEIGAAEGVLSLLLANTGHDVLSIELRKDRSDEAKALRERWHELGFNVTSCGMFQGDIMDNLHLLREADCLVAVRCIYHIGANAERLMAAAHEGKVKRIVLCGNKNRAARPTAPYDHYSSIAGMKHLLRNYEIEHVVSQGDPIVTGIYRPR